MHAIRRRRRRLVLIHAPSGFGKSTLAAQWREELVRGGVAVGWLTIDDDDNNAAWFLTHLLESIRRVRPELAASLGQILEEHGDDAGRYVLTSLIDEIHDKDDQIALVIDDWHRVSDPGTTAALGFLLERGCHHLQIIVTSWSRAGLPVSKLRVHDELVEIDCGSLRFDENEACSFLNDIGGLQLSGSDVNALAASTDGWPAALQLATLSLRSGADVHRLMSGVSGENDVIGEFLAENVLAVREPEMAEFLLSTSLTERTCGALASVMAEPHAGKRCSTKSSGAGCSSNGSTTTRIGFATTTCSRSSYDVDSNVTTPTGSVTSTGAHRRGSPNMII